jgi:YjbE family integral membrane protein
MDIFSIQFLYALATIVMIDLVLAGDNAIVIALAARKLPPALQRKAIIWGTVGAIVVRSLLTFAVVWLLKIPGLMFVGGALLLWIAVQLLIPDDEVDADQEGAGASNFFGAMKTIIVADTVMGLDNVLGVAGAAQGSFLLVVLGLLISIPIVVWGSTIILKWVERYPIIVYIGAAVLALTAAKMMLAEPIIQPYFAPYKAWTWPIVGVVVAAVVGIGYRLANAAKARNSATRSPG